MRLSVAAILTARNVLLRARTAQASHAPSSERGNLASSRLRAGATARRVPWEARCRSAARAEAVEAQCRKGPGRDLTEMRHSGGPDSEKELAPAHVRYRQRAGEA